MRCLRVRRQSGSDWRALTVLRRLVVSRSGRSSRRWLDRCVWSRTGRLRRLADGRLLGGGLVQRRLRWIM